MAYAVKPRMCVLCVITNEKAGRKGRVRQDSMRISPPVQQPQGRVIGNAVNSSPRLHCKYFLLCRLIVLGRTFRAKWHLPAGQEPASPPEQSLPRQEDEQVLANVAIMRATDTCLTFAKETHHTSEKKASPPENNTEQRTLVRYQPLRSPPMPLSANDRQISLHTKNT